MFTLVCKNKTLILQGSLSHFRQHLLSTFCVNFRSPKDFKTQTLSLHKSWAKHFYTKKLLIKCWWKKHHQYWLVSLALKIHSFTACLNWMWQHDFRINSFIEEQSKVNWCQTTLKIGDVLPIISIWTECQIK